MVRAHPDDDLTQRDCLNKIMTDCAAISVAPYVFLEKKILERHSHSLVKGIVDEFRCRDCGETFPTHQARNGHMAHCKQKGGESWK